MNYEGYKQCICSKGHYYERDAYFDDRVCPVCLSPAAWFNSVDETNGAPDGKIPIVMLRNHFIISSEEKEICNLGHQHLTKHAVFSIPKQEEIESLRSCECCTSD